MITTIDFETEAIVHNPVWLAPKPVGVAIHEEGKDPVYLAWGHPTENNCTKEQAIKALAEVWDTPLLFHNSAFDISVATQHLGLPWPADPLNVHDTMYSLFLADPYSPSFSLKPCAKRYLGLEPTEQTELKSWLVANVPEATAKNFGAYISKAPGDLVGKYAIGDVVRTRLLHDFVHSKVIAEGMVLPYQREQKLMPILAAASRRGIGVDRDALGKDEVKYDYALDQANRRIFEMCGGEFNVDSSQQLVEVLEKLDAVEEWAYTEKGAKSTARKKLKLRPKFAELGKLLDYRGILDTYLNTFIRSWIELSAIDGKLHPEWNSTRGERTKTAPNGTRTGRLSCSNPNFQNVPNASDVTIPEGLPPLPEMRSYVRPPDGHVWLKRDFSAQEMRIMAHFAEGSLYEAYKKNPDVDPHDMVRELIKTTLGLDLPRKHVKITGFGTMYGMGIQSLADQLDVPYEEGAKTKQAYFAALPEVKRLAFATKQRGQSGQAITTWGGRKYYVEQSAGRDLSYKLLNYLIQGSAADQTKQSIIDWDEAKQPDDVFLATVHDENNVSAPIADKEAAMTRLRLSMDADRFDVPFRSEGFAGLSWGSIEEYEA